MSFGIPELMVILIIVLLLFGTKKLKNMGSDLGSAIKGFRSAMQSDKKQAKLEADSPAAETNESLAEPSHSEKQV